VGNRGHDFGREFLSRLATALERNGKGSVSAEHLAEMRYAVSAGTKYRVQSREEYLERIRTAVRAVYGTRR
jgi:hypothetical protein